MVFPSPGSALVMDHHSGTPMPALSRDALPKLMGRFKLPDGRRVLIVAEAATHRRVGVWDDGDTRWLIDDPARNIERAFVPQGSQEALAVVVELAGGRQRTSLLDLETGLEDLQNMDRFETTGVTVINRF